MSLRKKDLERLLKQLDADRETSRFLAKLYVLGKEGDFDIVRAPKGAIGIMAQDPYKVLAQLDSSIGVRKGSYAAYSAKQRAHITAAQYVFEGRRYVVHIKAK
jgi:hypothetical protein